MGRKANWFCAVKQALGSDCRDQRSIKSKKKWFVKKKKKSANAISNPPAAADNISTTTAPATTTPVLPPPPPVVVVEDIKQLPTAQIPVEEDVKLKEEITEEDEQKKHAQSIAIATAKAAEAAAAAAQAAAEVIRLTNAAPSPKKPKEEEEKEEEEEEPKEELAALRIQTAFRAYLARRALRALRGLASLNIVMQVKFVNPQRTNTLKSMQSLVRVQSHVRSKRLRVSENNQIRPLDKQVKELEKVENLLQSGNGWNSSPKSKEQTEARLQSQHEATMKRERALTYSLKHQKTWRSSPTSKSADTMMMDTKSRHSGWSWLERWLAARPWETANGPDLVGPQEKKTSASSSPTTAQGRGGRLSTSKVRVSPLTPKPTSPKASPRRSFSCPEEDAKSTLSGQSSSSGEEETLPSYMAPTESARAKTDRLSMSTAKKRASSPTRSRRSASSITDANSVAEHQTLINAM